MMPPDALVPRIKIVVAMQAIVRGRHQLAVRPALAFPTCKLVLVILRHLVPFSSKLVNRAAARGQAIHMNRVHGFPRVRSEMRRSRCRIARWSPEM
jgi:hypothetical protein